MFDPKKYDTDNITTTDNSDINESFVSKRNALIKYLRGFRNFMVTECESLERHIALNPDSGAVRPFKKKITGWSKIINGVDIISEMYNVD